MKIIIASPNFKLFAGRDTEFLYFYREKNLLWKKKLPASETKLLGLANNGHLLVQTPEGLFSYYASGEESILPLEPYRPKILEEKGIVLGNILLEELGNGFLIEKLTERQKITESFLGFLKKKKETPDIETVYELARFDMDSHMEETVCSFAIEKGKGKFLWTATHNLDYLVIAEERPKPFPQKGFSSKMLLSQPKNGKYIYEVTMEETSIGEIAINNSGVVMAKLETPEETEFLGIKPNGEKFFITSPSRNVFLRHLGEKFLLLEEPVERVFYFKDFENKTFITLNVKILDELDTQLHFFFKPNDDPILVAQEADGKTLQLSYTTLENLEIQFQSWVREAQQKKAQPQTSELQKEQEEAEKQREAALALKSQELSKALAQEEISNAKPVESPGEKKKVSEQLDAKVAPSAPRYQINEIPFEFESFTSPPSQAEAESESFFTPLEKKQAAEISPFSSEIPLPNLPQPPQPLNETKEEQTTPIQESTTPSPSPLSAPINEQISSKHFEPTKAQLLKELERLKLLMITGELSREEGEQKKAEIEKQLQNLEPKDLIQKPAQTEPTTHSVPAKKEKLDLIPLEIPPNTENLSSNQTNIEKERIEKLLEKLEERFIHGEISEKAYQELKEKYEQKLRSLP